MALEFEARYFLEHKALPNALYNEGARLIRSFLIDRGAYMLKQYNRLTEITPEYECPYTDEDFKVNFRSYIRDQEMCMVLRLEMPEPEQPLLCRAVYLCYGTKGGYELYVTSEFAEDGNYYICAWNDVGCHFNFGEAPSDPSDEMDMAADLFWRSIEYVRNIESEGVCGGQS